MLQKLNSFVRLTEHVTGWNNLWSLPTEILSVYESFVISQATFTNSALGKEAILSENPRNFSVGTSRTLNFTVFTDVDDSFYDIIGNKKYKSNNFQNSYFKIPFYITNYIIFNIF